MRHCLCQEMCCIKLAQAVQTSTLSESLPMVDLDQVLTIYVHQQNRRVAVVQWRTWDSNHVVTYSVVAKRVSRHGES